MASIVIMVTSIGAVESGDDVRYSGTARCSGMSWSQDPLLWSCDVDPTALATTINAAIQTAATDAATAAGITVGALDKKTLLAGAVGL